MKELSLKCLQQIELELLIHIREFCSEHGLRYFLSNGTLLGAIKYHGFIPWDDDIDIFLPREDYDKLIRNYRDFGSYKLFSPERVAGYAFPFAKFCDMTTRREENNNNNGVELGVDIDIFPLDVWDNNAKRQAKMQAIRMVLLRLAKNRRITSTSPVKAIMKKAVAAICKPLGSAFFINRLSKSAVLSSQGESSYAGCVVWPVYGDHEIIPAEVFSDTVEVEFEGEMFPAPIGYDTYLRSLYGDYEKDPPLEKQKSHHHFKAYRL